MKAVRNHPLYETMKTLTIVFRKYILASAAV